MKKTRHTEEQIAFALKQAETGTSVAEVIGRMGISEQTFYLTCSPETLPVCADDAAAGTETAVEPRLRQRHAD